MNHKNCPHAKVWHNDSWIVVDEALRRSKERMAAAEFDPTYRPCYRQPVMPR